MHDVETVRAPLPPEAMSLPARYYTDPEYYRSELEWFFFGMWVHAGRADEIPNPGDFLVREIAGESLILVRSEGGELECVLQRLPPPGHPVDRGKVGTVRVDDSVSVPRLDL